MSRFTLKERPPALQWVALLGASLICVAAFELMRLPDTPAEVAIDEYVEIAKSFFHGTEARFINAALDAIGRDERSV